MNKNPNDLFVAGCAAFGLSDSVIGPDGMAIWNTDFFPGSVVLPGKSSGLIAVGEEARQSRIHSGLPWPPEAWISAGENLRRAPICCVWRALVEARDRQARWEVGGGISFPLARILAAHVVNLLVQPGEGNQIAATLAIPDDLDEYGQEILLSEMKSELARREVRGEVRLLWRPVAAGLAWLDEAGGDMKRNIIENNPDDFFIVLYLGPDAVECVPFRLRVRRHRKADNIENDYILLRRERPKGVSVMAGYDWPASVLEEMLQQKGVDDAGAFWQAWALFPELWQILAGRSLCQKSLPRIWGQKNGYNFWAPTGKYLEDKIERTLCRPSNTLRGILKASCGIQGTSPQDCSWSKKLTDLVRETVWRQKEGRLVGMVVCGSLAPSEPPFWLSACFPDLEARGLETNGPWDSREANRLWLSPGNCAIGLGAVIFQERLCHSEPTYLDTLPQYFLLTKADGKYTTSPLVDAEDVDGGETYSKKIHGFAIDEDRHRLDVVIVRETSHEELFKSGGGVDRLDLEVGKGTPDLNITEASLVRHLVRTAKKREDALRRLKWNLRNLSNHKAAMSYGNAYADLWYGQQDKTERKQPSLWKDVDNTLKPQDKTDTPFRKLSFPFPAPSPQKMPVELQVCIRPASGMAQMEVIPQDTTFLHGRRVFVDYRTMRTCPPEEITSETRGWPPIEELTTHPEVSLWQRQRFLELVDRFEITKPMSPAFNQVLDQVYDFIRMPKSYFFPVGGERLWLHVLSQDGIAGCPEGEFFITRFVDILQKHTAELVKWDRKRAGRMIIRASWLWAATPPNVKSRIRREIDNNRAVIEPGSRSLTATEDLSSIFQSIVTRLRTDGKFPDYNIRACKNILTLRKNGQDALTEKTVNALLMAVLWEIESHAKQNRFQNKFFASIKLLLYLLRYRKLDERFLPAASEKTDKINYNLKGFLASMGKNMPKTRFEKAREIINGTIDYLNFVGRTDFLQTLAEYSDTPMSTQILQVKKIRMDKGNGK